MGMFLGIVVDTTRVIIMVVEGAAIAATRVA